jgi:hypothetical protein
MTETTEYMGAMRRMIRAAGRRAADGDEPELRDLLALQGELSAAVQVAVDGQRALGRSWAWIAAATGATRQAAYQRWGRS